MQISKIANRLRNHAVVTSTKSLALVCAQPALGGAVRRRTAAGPDGPNGRVITSTPIKHVIVIIGENRSFDHVFATYEPVNKNEKILNLLSRRDRPG